MVQPRPPAVDRSREYFAAAIGALLALGLSAVLVPFRNDLSNANAALVLVLPVLLAAILGGRWAGAGTAVVSALCFDFFFTKPFQSLTISKGDDVETLIVLLVVALIASELGIRARRGVLAARSSRSELERLYRVAELAAAGAEAEDVTLAVQAELIGLFGLEDCRFRSDGDWTHLPRLNRRGAIEGVPLSMGPFEFELPAGGIALPVMGRGRTFGHLLLDAAPGTSASLEQRIVAVALADELGVTLAAGQNQSEV